ncbi:MAG: hypothetical protein ACOYD9_08335 [Pyramidobacter sp.]|jgi:hypothetical protein
MSQKKTPLRWFCGVPIFANPLILMDLFSALVILWLLTALLMVCAQLFLGDGPLLASHLTAASVFAGWLVIFSLALYTAVVVLFYPRGYVMLFRLEDSCLYLESLRGKASGGSLFRAKPFAVGLDFAPRRSVAKEIPWADVRSISEIKDMNVILLKRHGTLARVYCPDKNTYEAALSFIKEKVSPNA